MLNPLIAPLIKLPSIPSYATENKDAYAEYITDKFKALPNLINDIFYRVYIKQGNFFFQLPVNPESIKVEYNLPNFESNLYGQGEIITPRKAKPKVTKFNGQFIKDTEHPANKVGLTLPPEIYIMILNTYLTNEEPVSLMVNSVDLISSFIDTTQYLSYITSFKYEERGGQVGDIYYEIEFTEYVEVKYQDLGITQLADEMTKNAPDILEPTADQKITGPKEIPTQGQAPKQTEAIKKVIKPIKQTVKKPGVIYAYATALLSSPLGGSSPLNPVNASANILALPYASSIFNKSTPGVIKYVKFKNGNIIKLWSVFSTQGIMYLDDNNYNNLMRN